LRDRWDLLVAEIRDLCSVQDAQGFSGPARVSQGKSIAARLAVWASGFPLAGGSQPVAAKKRRTDKGEIWKRRFGGRFYKSDSTPSPEPYRYRERFWLFNFERDLPVEGGCLYLPVRRGWCLNLPLRRSLLP
jgi:hypothetical protein